MQVGLPTRTIAHRVGRGFTLVEVIAVVVVMALLAGAAALSFVGPVRRATAREAVDRVASFDEACRLQATRFDRDAEMLFSLAESKLTLRADGNPPRATRLPDGVRIDRVRVAGAASRNAAFGEVTVACSRLGLTPTYALKLDGSGFERWLVVPGLGGGAIEVTDEHEVDRIFATLAQVRDLGPARSDHTR